MYSSSLTAIVLCLAAQGALANCGEALVSQEPTATVPAQRPAGTTASTQAGQRPGPALIATASAGTRDDSLSARSNAAHRDDEHESPRRGGTAMLLAALALMWGIVLRRYGAKGP